MLGHGASDPAAWINHCHSPTGFDVNDTKSVLFLTLRESRLCLDKQEILGCGFFATRQVTLLIIRVVSSYLVRRQ